MILSEVVLMRRIWHWLWPDGGRELVVVLGKAYWPAAALLAVLIILNQWGGISFVAMLRDPLSSARLPPYYGWLSNVGVLLWAAAATLCFFTAALLRKKSNRQVVYFFTTAGLFTTFLLVDVLFLVHDYIFPRILHWSERPLQLGYALLLLGHLWYFRPLWQQTDFLLCFIAVAFLGLSLVVDTFLSHIPARIFFEDGFKLVGIVGWFHFWARTCWQKITYDE